MHARETVSEQCPVSRQCLLAIKQPALSSGISPLPSGISPEFR
ncbi:MAG: hypothetical protein OJF52_000943 [Nitrospira sp.]|nr:MAG: hypothetical protein OJF52_000943 [Nitrospira sp.]